MGTNNGWRHLHTRERQLAGTLILRYWRGTIRESLLRRRRLRQERRRDVLCATRNQHAAMPICGLPSGSNS